ncbi:hypothetical protein [Bilophila wadsworthia]|uniref:hypothetical protein n=1 Tax=Bilophila wadsworthia TaxID=35833 RepID=UPI003990C538
MFSPFRTPQRTSGTPMANATMKPTPAKVIPSCPMPECPNFSQTSPVEMACPGPAANPCAARKPMDSR